jgi:CRP-like cAMP-binding protein
MMSGANGNGSDNDKHEVARLGEGKFFGEMALMTGEPRMADVVATCDSELLVLGHGAFHATLAANPDLALVISRAIVERQAKLEAHAQSRQDVRVPIEERTSQLLGKIKQFFSLR